MKRDQRIAVRVTALEKTVLAARAAEHPEAHSVSHFLRLAGLGAVGVPLRDPQQPAEPQRPSGPPQTLGMTSALADRLERFK